MTEIHENISKVKNNGFIGHTKSSKIPLRRIHQVFIRLNRPPWRLIEVFNPAIQYLPKLINTIHPYNNMSDRLFGKDKSQTGFHGGNLIVL